MVFRSKKKPWKRQSVIQIFLENAQTALITELFGNLNDIGDPREKRIHTFGIKVFSPTSKDQLKAPVLLERLFVGPMTAQRIIDIRNRNNTSFDRNLFTL